MIAAGRVTVNGKIVKKAGTKVNPDRDKVAVDGKVLRAPKKNVYFMMNKPSGVISAAHDPQGRPTVIDLIRESDNLPSSGRVFHVGRLDFNTEGLLLLTSDGPLSQALTHPSNQVPRVYLARLKGSPSKDVLGKLIHGLELEDGWAKAQKINIWKRNPKTVWVEVQVTEGRNRLIRRLFEALGYPVTRLVRTEYGGLSLGDLARGKIRRLVPEEVMTLQAWQESYANKK